MICAIPKPDMVERQAGALHAQPNIWGCVLLAGVFLQGERVRSVLKKGSSVGCVEYEVDLGAEKQECI